MKLDPKEVAAQLLVSFNWTHSKYGSEYWSEVYKRLIEEEEKNDSETA